MAVIRDPEGNETSNLNAMIDFKDARVFEIGCGDGRLTWRYADQTAHVTAIDPFGEEIEKAKDSVPEALKVRVIFLETTLEDYAATTCKRDFDVAIFSWSL